MRVYFFNKIKNRFYKIKSKIFPVFEIRDFCDVNAKKWQFLKTKNVNKNINESVLIDVLTEHPAYVMTNNIVGGFIKYKKKLNKLYLINSPLNRKMKMICNSYGSGNFIYLGYRKLNVFTCIKSLYVALKLYRNIKNKTSITPLQYEGILIGDLIYDTYLRMGNITFSKKTFVLFKVLYNAILTKKYYDMIFKKWNIKAVVLGHMVYVAYGLLARTAINNDIPIYARARGPVFCAVKKYSNPKKIKEYQLRPSSILFNYIYYNYKKLAIEHADQYLKRRFESRVHQHDVLNAFNPNKITMNKNEFSNKFNLSLDKPFVCIMAHIFKDAPHSNSWQIFDDYLIWLQKTLSFIVSDNSVNWLIKPHPSAKMYGEYNLVEREVNNITKNYKNTTVRVVSNEINTKSLVSIADAILTVCGTAGLEFSCFGIPCILAGESPYSGFGFTLEPKTKEEYFDILKNIKKIEKLEKEQIEKAKIMAFLYFELMLVKTDLIPDMPVMVKFNENSVWDKAKTLIRENDPLDDNFYKEFCKFINKDYDYLLNYGLVGLEGKSI